MSDSDKNISELYVIREKYRELQDKYEKLKEAYDALINRNKRPDYKPCKPYTSKGNTDAEVWFSSK